jgi:hypothetical protein
MKASSIPGLMGREPALAHLTGGPFDPPNHFNDGSRDEGIQ